MRDGHFYRSVVLLTDYEAGQGAYGLILNHPTGKTVGDYLKGEEFKPLRQFAVHEGGPVSRGELTFSAFWWGKSGLRWAARISAEETVKYAHRPGTLVRAYIGYSGWAAGQLESELGANAWITTRPSDELWTRDHDRDLWAALLRGISPMHRILAEAPDDPFLN